MTFEFDRHDGLFAESGLWIDLDGDGDIDEEGEHFMDGEFVRVGGEVYRIELDYP